MTPWERATLALKLLSIDPQRLGGMVVRARVGPARDALLGTMDAIEMPCVRLHPHMGTQVLDGEVDLSATLSGGTLVRQRGLLDRPPSLFILPMAERAEPALSARLGQALDAGHSHALLALDEGSEEGETVPLALQDRTAFHVALDGIAMSDLAPIDLPQDTVALRRLARAVHVPDDILEDMVMLANAVGITSLRAPGFTLNAAQCHAALHGRDVVEQSDVSAAVALIYAHRATKLPDQPEDQTQPPEKPPDAPDDPAQTAQPNDILLDAITAALPPDALVDLSTRGPRRATGSGSGARRTGNRRGRPLPARQGPNANAARVDLIATLRAAIPWQTLRKRADPARNGPIFRQSDLRKKRYDALSDRLLIFTVDASGSAAMSRLAEAKGAVELMLAQAYARRDHVALVSYRGNAAEVLLSPTRSLVQTKRRLAAIPGGGATPLASGLAAAMDLAQTAAQKGLTPTVILLADGRANIARDGSADRALAHADATKLATKIAAARCDALVIDTTNRPEKTLRQLAQHMAAKYIPLPRADAKRVSGAISASLAE